MPQIASRELRNNTRSVLDRVHRGESIVITVDGRPVAELKAIEDRPRWLSRETFAADILTRQADPGLSDELWSLIDETTDDLPDLSPGR